MRKRFIKIGDRNYPVAYNMGEFEQLEKHFDAPLSGIFEKIQANLNTSTIRILVKVGLEGGENAQGKTREYSLDEVDALLSGRILPISTQFMEAAAEDMGIEAKLEESKNPKARK